MSTSELSFDEVLALARRLGPVDQARLAARLAPMMDHVLARMESPEAACSQPSLRGLLSDLGPAPSGEDIEDIRREMWPTFSPESP
jgi:hypothetical protein